MARTTTGPVKRQDADEPPAGERAPSALTEFLRNQEIGVVAAVAVLVVAFSLANGNFASVSNMQTMGVDLAQYGLLALGVSFVMLTGGIDLSIGSVVAFSAVWGAWLNVHVGLPGALAIAVVLGTGALIGLAHGFAVTVIRVPPFVTTLVTLVAARGAALAITKGFPIDGVGTSFSNLAQLRLASIPVPALLFAGACVIAWFFLERTYIGRQVYAVGGNAEAARLAGIRTERRVVLAYIVSGVCAAAVGVLVTGRLGVGQPSIGNGWELNAIAAAVIGGISLTGGSGRVLGVAFGAILLVCINSGLVIMHVSPYYQQIVLGAVLAVAIVTDRLRARSSERRQR
ncbi:ABC transporter permease [Actinomadura sp. LD22]|uniref:ABC transporter permease n=1 Tax=Actinomadura physcomitrii TaxID=2650748 RepID=A0A6I4MJ80_9ACTN|nr:ABC transporter permease [Actinomadura physcomitrii]MWA02689.1 ABC transporter permease [Actinomadura physcomitrii]